MKLSELLAALPDGQAHLAGDPEITGIAYDSRKVESGFLFVAIPGTAQDGHAYVPQAIASGAIAVVVEHEMALPEGISQVIVPHGRNTLAQLSAKWYDYPDRSLRLIGVTGTNGKTTTTLLIRYLLERAGHKCGVIGTVGAHIGKSLMPELESASTTPESLELYQLLAKIRAEECNYAVIEVSSHALDQGRVSACDFSAAVFTNLTQDHLDYHGTMDNYCACKVKLFEMLDTEKLHRYSVINADDAYSERFIEASDVTVWTFGEQDGCTVQLMNYSESITGMHFQVKYQNRVFKVKMPLTGKFNIYNAMAAFCVALGENLPVEDVVGWFRNAPQVPGRFELVDEGQDFSVVVDYAHTPDGLENLLSAAKALKPRRLITLFGCGGDRDVGKRPIMGRLAGLYSNVAILTSDNPRSEEPMAILAQIEAGISKVSTNYLVEPDRAKAIHLAINMASTGDIVVLAGKGHENYQIIGNEKHHFDDREMAREVLKKKLRK